MYSEETPPDIFLREKVLKEGFAAFLLLLTPTETEKLVKVVTSDTFLQDRIDVLASPAAHITSLVARSQTGAQPDLSSCCPEAAQTRQQERT